MATTMRQSPATSAKRVTAGPGMATVIASITDARQRAALKQMNIQLETEVRQTRL